MPIYIALLRGVNVGGNMLKMDRLRELCTELGAKNARTNCRAATSSSKRSKLRHTGLRRSNASAKQAGLTARRRSKAPRFGQSEMLVGKRGGDAAALCAVEQAELHQIRLVDFLDGVFFFAE